MLKLSITQETKTTDIDPKISRLTDGISQTPCGRDLLGLARIGTKVCVQSVAGPTRSAVSVNKAAAVDLRLSNLPMLLTLKCNVRHVYTYREMCCPVQSMEHMCGRLQNLQA